MYCDVRQWRHIRRRIMVKGTPKKQVSRETGISRQTITRMLAHEFPPGYHPRPRRYPKLGPYIHTINYLLHDTILFPPKADLTMRDIFEYLRREEGFAGSYDSVRNYIRQRSCDNEKAWERAYELIIRLPKSRALDFVRLLSRDNPPTFASARLQSFVREATCPRKPQIRPDREGKRRADFEWMRQVLQKEINDDTLHRDGIPDLSVLLQAPPQRSPAGSQSRYGSSTERWNDVPRGTMDEVSSYVRLDLPFSTPVSLLVDPPNHRKSRSTQVSAALT